jgi:hypothetical protein
MPGPKVLLIGPTGSGKTYSLRTLLNLDLEPFFLFTEPGMETLGAEVLDKAHWAYLPPATSPFSVLLDNADRINTTSAEGLSKQIDMNKRAYRQFYDLLKLLNNFVCSRTGESFGDVSTWNQNRVLVIDSLSGLNQMSLDLTTGSRVTRSFPEWGIAMDNLERLVMKLCYDCACMVVITGHIEPERDETTGAVINMVSTIGRKLAPKLPRHFSEVILTRREGTRFYWSTADTRTDLKSRLLGQNDKHEPSFAPLVTEWRRRAGVTFTKFAATAASTPAA